MELIIELDPLTIYFTHSTISSKFTGCGKSIMESYEEIIKDKSIIDKIPKIKVYYDGSKFYSENNRRLFLFKLLSKKGIIKNILCRLEILKGKKLSRFLKNTYSLESTILY